MIAVYLLGYGFIACIACPVAIALYRLTGRSA